MVIHDVKKDPILQIPGWEPSASSTYGHQGQGILDTSNHAREQKFGTQVKSNIKRWSDVKDDPFLQVTDQEPPISS